MNRFSYASVGATPAQIASHRLINIRIGWLCIRRKECGGRHDLSGLAVATLRDLFGNPGLLHRVRCCLTQPFDRCDLFPNGGCDWNLT